MLQARLPSRSIAEAEVEEPDPHRSMNARTIEPAKGRRLRIDDPKPVAVCGQSGRLREPGGLRRAVDQTLVSDSRGHGQLPFRRVEGPQLVDTRHRDPDLVAPPREANRR